MTPNFILSLENKSYTEIHGGHAKIHREKREISVQSVYNFVLSVSLVFISGREYNSKAAVWLPWVT
jgi:hypothetical protein